MLSSTTKLFIVELIIYLLITPVVFYIWYRHGKHGFLGYFFLSTACTLRVVSDIIQIAESSNDATPSLSGSIIGSVGLSPLILAFSGFLHETHRHVIAATARTSSEEKRSVTWLWFSAIHWHGICGAGMALIVVGAVKIVPPTTDDQIQLGEHLREAGAMVLLALYALLAHYNLWLLRQTSQLQTSIGFVTKRLAVGTLISSVFILIKIIYSVAYSFDHDNKSLNPSTGSLAVKVIFVVLVQLGAVVGLMATGWQTRAISLSHIPSSTVYYREAARSEDAQHRVEKPAMRSFAGLG